MICILVALGMTSCGGRHCLHYKRDNAPWDSFTSPECSYQRQPQAEMGPDHSATRALAKASITMTTADLWQARLALKTLRLDQREAIAVAADE